MCLDPQFYSDEKYDAISNSTTKRNDIFNLTRNEHIGCPENDVSKFDTRWTSFVTYAESGVYT